MLEAPGATLLHVSDLHVGPPFRAAVGEALLRAMVELQPTAVVVSGDLVQRAESLRQWRAAQAYLARVSAPLLCVPGNHDLPVFDPVRRLLTPVRRYRRYVAGSVERVLTLPGVTLIGVATSKRWTIDRGYVSIAQRDWIEACVRAAPGDDLKVVVMHHALRHQPVGIARNDVHDARRLVTYFAAAGVQLVLSGHNHFPHVEVLRGDTGGALIWSQAGTATSDRLRHPDWPVNTFSRVRVEPWAVEIEWWSYLADEDAFVCVRAQSFARGALI